MLCDDCKKNEACVHITQISAEGKIDKNLCESCAAKYGDFMFQPKDKNLSVNDFLKGIFSNAQQEEPQEQETAARQKPQTKLACPNCGKELPVADVNIAQDVALCRACGFFYCG